MKTLVHDMDVKNEGIAIGISRGIAHSIIELLSECGEVPDALKEKIYSEKDVKVLKGWTRFSARVCSVEEFMEKM